MLFLRMRLSPLLIVMLLAAFPSVASAGQYFGRIDDFFLNVAGFINDILIPFIFTIALVFFLFGAYKHFIYKGASSEVDKEAGRNLMIYAVAGFVLMVSIWGIVNFLADGLLDGMGTNNTVPQLPTFN